MPGLTPWVFKDGYTPFKSRARHIKLYLFEWSNDVYDAAKKGLHEVGKDDKSVATNNALQFLIRALYNPRLGTNSDSGDGMTANFFFHPHDNQHTNVVKYELVYEVVRSGVDNHTIIAHRIWILIRDPEYRINDAFEQQMEANRKERAAMREKGGNISGMFEGKLSYLNIYDTQSLIVNFGRACDFDYNQERSRSNNILLEDDTVERWGTAVVTGQQLAHEMTGHEDLNVESFDAENILNPARYLDSSRMNELSVRTIQAVLKNYSPELDQLENLETENATADFGEFDGLDDVTRDAYNHARSRVESNISFTPAKADPKCLFYLPFQFLEPRRFYLCERPEISAAVAKRGLVPDSELVDHVFDDMDADAIIREHIERATEAAHRRANNGDEHDDYDEGDENGVEYEKTRFGQSKRGDTSANDSLFRALGTEGRDLPRNAVNDGESVAQQIINRQYKRQREILNRRWNKKMEALKNHPDEDERKSYWPRRKACMIEATRAFERGYQVTDALTPVDKKQRDYLNTCLEEGVEFDKVQKRHDIRRTQFFNDMSRHAVKLHHICKVSSNHSTIMFLYISSLTRYNGINDMKVHVWCDGPAMAGKSFALDLVQELSMPGTVWSENGQTNRADSAEQDSDGVVVIWHEVPLDKVMGKDGAKTGNADFKDILTKSMYILRAFEFEENEEYDAMGRRKGTSKKRSVRVIASSAIRVYLVATNEKMPAALAPVASRFVNIPMHHLTFHDAKDRRLGKKEPNNMTTLYKTLTSHDQEEYIKMKQRFHIQNFLVYLVETFITMGIIKDVMLEYFTIKFEIYRRRLEKRSKISVSARDAHRLLMWTRSLVIVDAISRCFNSELSQIRVARMRDAQEARRKKLPPPPTFQMAYLLQIEPYLVAYREVSLYATTSYPLQDFMSHRILQAMAQMFSNNYTSGTRHFPIAYTDVGDNAGALQPMDMYDDSYGMPRSAHERADDLYWAQTSDRMEPKFAASGSRESRELEAQMQNDYRRSMKADYNYRQLLKADYSTIINKLPSQMSAPQPTQEEVKKAISVYRNMFIDLPYYDRNNQLVYKPGSKTELATKSQRVLWIEEEKPPEGTTAMLVNKFGVTRQTFRINRNFLDLNPIEIEEECMKAFGECGMEDTVCLRGSMDPVFPQVHDVMYFRAEDYENVPEERIANPEFIPFAEKIVLNDEDDDMDRMFSARSSIPGIQITKRLEDQIYMQRIYDCFGELDDPSQLPYYAKLAHPRFFEAEHYRKLANPDWVYHRKGGNMRYPEDIIQGYEHAEIALRAFQKHGNDRYRLDEADHVDRKSNKLRGQASYQDEVHTFTGQFTIAHREFLEASRRNEHDVDSQEGLKQLRMSKAMEAEFLKDLDTSSQIHGFENSKNALTVSGDGEQGYDENWTKVGQLAKLSDIKRTEFDPRARRLAIHHERDRGRIRETFGTTVLPGAEPDYIAEEEGVHKMGGPPSDHEENFHGEEQALMDEAAVQDNWEDEEVIPPTPPKDIVPPPRRTKQRRSLASVNKGLRKRARPADETATASSSAPSTGNAEASIEEEATALFSVNKKARTAKPVSPPPAAVNKTKKPRRKQLLSMQMPSATASSPRVLNTSSPHVTATPSQESTPPSNSLFQRRGAHRQRSFLSMAQMQQSVKQHSAAVAHHIPAPASQASVSMTGGL